MNQKLSQLEASSEIERLKAEVGGLMQVRAELTLAMSRAMNLLPRNSNLNSVNVARTTIVNALSWAVADRAVEAMAAAEIKGSSDIINPKGLQQ